MTTDIARNLRLVASTTLLSVWGYSHLAQTPVLGDTIAPLLAALFLAPGAQWFDRSSNGDYRPLLIALLALVLITWLLFSLGTDESLTAFSHSPYFVLPVWALGLLGLVRNATNAERLAASAQAASVAGHVTDAG